jgi:2-keto-3-deoxy-L-rhamnonate aldolase RhmA
VVVPHIRSVQDAKDVAMAARFQPPGHRSSTNGLPHFQLESYSAKVSNSVVNASVLTRLQMGWS